MKNRNQIISVLLLTSPFAHADGHSGVGGGRAIVCRDDSKKIISAQMLDIAEGLEILPFGYGLTIAESNDQNMSQNQKDSAADLLLDQSLKKLKGLAFADKVADLAKQIRSEKLEEPAGSSLLPPEDMGQIHLRSVAKGCALEAVGEYLADKKLHVNTEIYQTLDTVNQTAFFLHEAIYTFTRNSVASRAFPGPLAGLQYAVATPLTSEGPRRITAELVSKLKKIDPEFIYSYGYVGYPLIENTFFDFGGGFKRRHLLLTSDMFTKVLNDPEVYAENNEVKISSVELDLFSKNINEASPNTAVLNLNCNRDTHICVLSTSNPGWTPTWFTEIYWDPSLTFKPRAYNSTTGKYYYGKKLKNI